MACLTDWNGRTGGYYWTAVISVVRQLCGFLVIVKIGMIVESSELMFTTWIILGHDNATYNDESGWSTGTFL